MKKSFFRNFLVFVISIVIIFAVSCKKNGTPLTDVTTSPDVTTEAPDNSTETSAPVNSDKESPSLALDSYPETVFTKSFSLTGVCSDNVGVTSISVKGKEIAPNENAFSVELELEAGENVFDVIATDEAGNVTSKTVRVNCIAYVNNVMAKDGVLTVYNAPAVANAHQDGFVFALDGEIYLLDAGMTDTSDASTYKYLLSLRNSVIASCEYDEVKTMKLRLNLIISHFHYDHVQALVEQILPDSNFEIANIYYTKASSYALGADSDEREGVFSSPSVANATLHELDFGVTKTLQAGELTIKLYAPCEDFGADQASKIRAIYYPSKDSSYACADAVENSNSMWMKLSYGGKDMLFTGDVLKKMHESYTEVGSYEGVGGEPFDLMIAYYGKDEFKADIIKFPHHGSERSAAMFAVTDVMRPDVIIFTSLYNEFRPVMYTTAGADYNGSYVTSGLEGMTFTLTKSGKLDAVRGAKSESVYGENGQYLGIVGELFEERSVSVTASVSLSGTGSEADPYLIGSREDLAYFAKNYEELCKNGGACFKLTADIVWSDYKSGILPVSNWTPIGSPAIGMTPFMGTFDGDGHSISGIYCAGVKEGVMNLSGNTYYLLGSVSGLFGAVNGTVKNLIIKDSSFFGNRMVGAIVAHIAPEGNTRIENCASYALVQGFEGCGGIFGGYYQRSSYGILHDDVDVTGNIVIERCVNFGPVNSVSTDSNSSVGGIVGSLREMKAATVKECANFGNVTSGGGCVGGIVGQVVYCKLTMNNCVNSGIVVGLTLTGGIVGKIQHDVLYPKTVAGLVNYGNVGVTKDGRVGYINGSDTGAAYHSAFKDSGCYYLSSAILVAPQGTKVVTDGTEYASYYISATEEQLKSLNGLSSLDTDVWGEKCNVEGVAYGLIMIKKITVVKLVSD